MGKMSNVGVSNWRKKVLNTQEKKKIKAIIFSPEHSDLVPAWHFNGFDVYTFSQLHTRMSEDKKTASTGEM